MSAIPLRTIITLVFLFHGIGQLMGVIPALKLFGRGTDAGQAESAIGC